MPAGKLRSVIASNRLRFPPPGDDPIQHPRHSPAAKTGIRLDGRAFTRETIQRRQQRSPRFVANPSDTKSIALPDWLCSATYFRPPVSPAASVSTPYSQVFLAVNSIYPLRAGLRSAALQQHAQTPVDVSITEAAGLCQGRRIKDAGKRSGQNTGEPKKSPQVNPCDGASNQSSGTRPLLASATRDGASCNRTVPCVSTSALNCGLSRGTIGGNPVEPAVVQ